MLNVPVKTVDVTHIQEFESGLREVLFVFRFRGLAFKFPSVLSSQGEPELIGRRANTVRPQGQQPNPGKLWSFCAVSLFVTS